MALPKLRLEFSKAADHDRIHNLYTNKASADPQNYVAMRLPDIFRKTVDDGCAALLSDDQNQIHAASLMYHLHETAPAAGKHEYAELGSAMASLAGFRSAHLVIAALSLKEWWSTPPQHLIAGEIKDINVASLKIYQGLGWEPVTDAAHVTRMNKASNDTVADDVHKTVLTGNEKSHWYMADTLALSKQANVILECINRGGLLNNKTGDIIPVDFTALDDVGLNKTRLQSLASGVTSRQTLQGLHHGP